MQFSPSLSSRPLQASNCGLLDASFFVTTHIRAINKCCWLYPQNTSRSWLLPPWSQPPSVLSWCYPNPQFLLHGAARVLLPKLKSFRALLALPQPLLSPCLCTYGFFFLKCFFPKYPWGFLCHISHQSVFVTSLKNASLITVQNCTPQYLPTENRRTTLAQLFFCSTPYKGKDFGLLMTVAPVPEQCRTRNMNSVNICQMNTWIERPTVMKDGKTEWLMVTILLQISDGFSATAIKNIREVWGMDMT